MRSASRERPGSRAGSLSHGERRSVRSLAKRPLPRFHSGNAATARDRDCWTVPRPRWCWDRVRGKPRFPAAARKSFCAGNAARRPGCFRESPSVRRSGRTAGSPVRTLFMAGIWMDTLPGVWPGVLSTSQAMAPNVCGPSLRSSHSKGSTLGNPQAPPPPISVARRGSSPWGAYTGAPVSLCRAATP